jgi:hypothetical protein
VLESNFSLLRHEGSGEEESSEETPRQEQSAFRVILRKPYDSYGVATSRGPRGWIVGGVIDITSCLNHGFMCQRTDFEDVETRRGKMTSSPSTSFSDRQSLNYNLASARSSILQYSHTFIISCRSLVHEFISGVCICVVCATAAYPTQARQATSLEVAVWRWSQTGAVMVGCAGSYRP